MKKIAKKINGIKERSKEPVSAQYELKVYQLLLIIMASIFIALILGFYFGNIIGYANVDIDAPDYCKVNKQGQDISIDCGELANLTAGDLCKMLSTPLENKIRVIIVT